MTQSTQTGASFSEQQILDSDFDISQLPIDEDLLLSNHIQAVQYRQALARASNAIEGVVLTQADKAFMSLSSAMAKEDFKSALLAHLDNTSGVTTDAPDQQRQGGQ